MSISIRHIFVSPGHNFFGHHGQPSGKNPLLELPMVECVAGRGLRGDRFFDHKPDYKGQVTLFAVEIFDALRRELGLTAPSPAVFRRNLITEGVDLSTLIGQRFTLQRIELEGVEECRPCYWMNEAVGPGAEAWLNGRGGLRCRILSSGYLHKEAR
ncbi:MAG: MOSC domain-containing protein [Opitutaceae bacterium]|jgi:MOSC domain-containing protein YiiM